MRAREWPPDVALAWTLRGAPHAYRRADLPDVEAALRPWSDAAQRIFDAAKPLRAAGIPPLDALAHAAATMCGVVAAPMGKGAASTAMTALVDEPYLRWRRGCQATHMYEMPFRLAALHAGLELEPDTSPPVLVPVPGWSAGHVGHLEPIPVRPDLDLVRAALRFVGPERCRPWTRRGPPAQRREQEERPAQWDQPYTELRPPFVMPAPRRATVRPARP